MIYKVISKIIVLRLRPLLPSLISPMQIAFIEGRKGTDNVIIAQELIYSLRKRKGRTRFMVVKIDLEKAYDCLEWSFIKMVLEHFGFLESMISLIMSYVSTSTTTLLFNGSKLDSFQPSRGIRQGDLISPYLFLLYKEFLGAQITSMCEDKRWDKVRASRSGPSFSHVLFADDLMLFAKADYKNCEAIIEVLDNFCNLAGQKVNTTKSKIIFSSNVTNRRVRGIYRRLGIAATTNLGKYLGFPIIHQGRVGNAYNFVVNKMQSKLAGWKSKLLSKAGKLVLVKSSATLVAEYYMQCQSLPIKVCNQIDKLIRDFLWGSTEEKRRLHLVRWETVMLPKELGGLGLHNMKDINNALLAKLCWRLACEQEAPWAKMLVAKYLSPSRISKVGRKLPCSSI